jgi:glycosyltransferase involved in cell wall biosynthesis
MFRRVHAENPGWTLVLAGSVEDSALCRQYLAELREQAADLPVDFRVDLSLSALRDLYSSSCLYWHATGLGVNPIRDPDRVEQFGIVLLEAMASGVIPIAYNAGGVSEIIQHGRSGFLWRRNEELVEITDRLIRCPALRAQLASEGRARSGQFELETFRQKVRTWFG